MSSQSANARKIGYTFGPLTIAQSPDAMIMCTNLFKKVRKELSGSQNKMNRE